MKKILIVNDERSSQVILGYKLDGRPDVTVLKAMTLEEGQAVFDANPDLDLVAMDGCMGGSKPNTQPLITHMRKSYTGPIVATSKQFNHDLMEAGCSHQADPENFWIVAYKVLQLT